VHNYQNLDFFFCQPIVDTFCPETSQWGVVNVLVLESVLFEEVKSALQAACLYALTMPTILVFFSLGNNSHQHLHGRLWTSSLFGHGVVVASAVGSCFGVDNFSPRHWSLGGHM
jgi:hypothetical protein